MDLTTNYVGLRLPHPLIVGASPLVGDLDTVRRGHRHEFAVGIGVRS